MNLKYRLCGKHKFTLGLPQAPPRDKASLYREEVRLRTVSAGPQQETANSFHMNCPGVSEQETWMAGVDGSGEASDRGSFSIFQD